MKKKKVYKNVYVNNGEKGIVPIKDAKRARLLRKINKVLNFAMALLAPIVLTFLAAIIQRGDAESAITWMNNNVGLCLLNQLTIIMFYFVLQFIIQKPGLCVCLTSFLYLLLPIVSKIKFDLRGEVLLVNELALAGNVGDMTSFIEISDTLLYQLLLSAACIVFFTMAISMRKFKINRITSGVFAALFLTLFMFIFFAPATSTNLLRAFGVNNGVRFSPNVVHEKQGTWIGLYSNYVLNKVSEPLNYSKEEVFRILNYTTKDSKTSGDFDPKEVSEKNPNIIIIMSESFFDPTVIPNVKYSEDPIPNFRKLLKECESGTLVTSTFGGGTSTVEFEVFTGETVEFMPYGTAPYNDLPNNIPNIDSIQKILKDNGYETIALHTYEGSFYNRNNVYPKLGFDDFLESKEMEEISYYGKYISDYTMNRNIQLQLEEEREDNHPLFIWALTMQNHTPYQTSNFTEGFDKIKIVDSPLSSSATDKLMAYVNEIHESDIQLQHLIDYLEIIDEPTVLLFFGDHLPSLYEVYHETGMIDTKVTSDWDTNTMLKMHSVPFFIYDNFSKDREVKHDNTVGAVLLGNKLLNYVGIPKSSYFRFLDTLNYSALRDRLFVDNNGKYYDAITKECEIKASEHKLLEYDMMYGENYVKEYDKNY